MRHNPDWEEIERAIAAVLELPEEQRAAYLAQQPPPVRGEVESLLAAYLRAGSFLGDETGKPIATANARKNEGHARCGKFRI